MVGTDRVLEAIKSSLEKSLNDLDAIGEQVIAAHLHYVIELIDQKLSGPLR